MEKLVKIQSELKAPKNQFNSFGKYNYRSCEDILEAVKPLLLKYNCTLIVSDEIKEVTGITFVQATCTFFDNELEDSEVVVTAQAGIDIHKKGMDISQSFGSSSSYARKYALNGLFLIDDTKDSDATNKHGKEEVKEAKPKMHQLTADNVKSIIAKGTQQEVLDQIGKKYMATTIQIKELMDSIKK